MLSVSKAGELNPRSGVAVKRFVDLVLSVLLVIVLSPLIGLVALAIKLTSPGPALFRE